jgi:hypothetical protein
MPRSRTITTAAVGLALAVPGVAAAQQTDLRSPDARSGMPSPSAQTVDRVSPDARSGMPAPAAQTVDRVSPDARSGMPEGTTTTPVITIPRTQVVEVPQTGFEWGDAAIGGVASLALLLAAGGLVLTVRPRRSATTH